MDAPQKNTPNLLEVRGVSKRFPGARALDDVNLTLAHGEVLAVIGENGAGKSTLMKILAGVQTADQGEILLEGQPISIPSPRAAQELGITLIHQELNLADNLDVASNIFLGREPRRWKFVDRVRLIADAAIYMAQVGLSCPPETLVSELAPGHRQLVEIARALSAQARILIMDEPTSSLSQGETEQLHRVVAALRGRGVAIVYISHRLGEVRALADRVLVLRDGRNAGCLAKSEITHDAMVSLMVGRQLEPQARMARPMAQALLEVRGLRTPAHPAHPISFQLGAGEIVGMAGLVGAGRTELLHTLFGIDRPLGGSIFLDGQLLRLTSPRDAVRAGMALAPEDRKLQGVILEMSVGSNATLASLRRENRRGILSPSRDQARGATIIRERRIKTTGVDQPVGLLSGGNQQKVVLAKWLALRPRVLLLDEPTRGIDVGAKQEIYRLIEELARQGMAILFVSSEMEEILRLSERALVMHQGRLAGELNRDQLSEEAVMRLATGGDGLPAAPGSRPVSESGAVKTIP